VVSTRDVKNNDVIPPVYIEQLRNFNETLPLDDVVTLDYDQSFMEISYTAISFTNPKKIEFKYRMLGFDDSWIEVGNRRSAIYTKIPPGEYTFQVSASNSDGIWNEKGASVKVSVIPPFWQTIWFLSILLLCFLAIGPTIYYFRIRHLKTENERQKKFAEQLIESQENERRRIASELHDGLGQQILVIKNRVELAKLNITNNLEMIDQLSEIQHSADRSIEDVRNISHNLRPVLLEKFGLTDAVLNFCDQLEKSTNLEWSYHVDDIDDVFPKNKEINFYRILQEGANNILKHAESKHPSIIVKRANNRINVTIYDDGKGYEAFLVSKTGTGLGLIGIKERVETLGGQLAVVSKKGEGTTIKIQIPINKYD
jgi:signal transduction histidine kinase